MITATKLLRIKRKTHVHIDQENRRDERAGDPGQ